MGNFKSKFKKSFFSMFIASSLVSMPFLASGQAYANEMGVQCISDQKSVGAGGKISYHILYHNVENKNGKHTLLKVHVPKDLEVDINEIDGAEWDAKSRVLSWKVKGNDRGAGVIHFNLKVNKDALKDSVNELECQLEQDNKVIAISPNVSVRTGSQIDQPFFAGYPDGLFHPTRGLTRAEAAAVVARILNLTDARMSRQYTDVGDHWALANINKVTNAGYMAGYQDGSFHPDAPISRAELVTLVLRIRGVQEIPMESFEDGKGHWAKNIIGTAKALKWIDGVGQGKFDADGPVQRQVAAVLFDIALSRGPLVDGDTQVVQHFPDVNPGSWSYHWIEEASKLAHEAVFRSDGVEHLIKYLPDQTEDF